MIRARTFQNKIQQVCFCALFVQVTNDRHHYGKVYTHATPSDTRPTSYLQQLKEKLYGGSEPSPASEPTYGVVRSHSLGSPRRSSFDQLRDMMASSPSRSRTPSMKPGEALRKIKSELLAPSQPPRGHRRPRPNHHRLSSLNGNGKAFRSESKRRRKHVSFLAIHENAFSRTKYMPTAQQLLFLYLD